MGQEPSDWDSCDGCKPLEGQICMLSLNSAHWVDDDVGDDDDDNNNDDDDDEEVFKWLMAAHPTRTSLLLCPTGSNGVSRKTDNRQNKTEKMQEPMAWIHLKCVFPFVFVLYLFFSWRILHMGFSWSKVYEFLIWSGKGFTNLRTWIKAMVNCNKTNRDIQTRAVRFPLEELMGSLHP